MRDNWIWVLIPITAILAGVLTTWIRARHGYPLDRRGGRSGEWPQAPELTELKQTLAAREATIAKLEERVRVLERIATDKPAALRDEIERLRT
jgi:hypothetical protein